MTPERRKALKAKVTRYGVLLALLEQQESWIDRHNKVIPVSEMGAYKADGLMRGLLDIAEDLESAWVAKRLLKGEGFPARVKPERWLRERPLMQALRARVARSVPGSAVHPR